MECDLAGRDFGPRARRDQRCHRAMPVAARGAAQLDAVDREGETEPSKHSGASLWALKSTKVAVLVSPRKREGAMAEWMTAHEALSRLARQRAAADAGTRSSSTSTASSCAPRAG